MPSHMRNREAACPGFVSVCVTIVKGGKPGSVLETEEEGVCPIQVRIAIAQLYIVNNVVSGSAENVKQPDIELVKHLALDQRQAVEAVQTSIGIPELEGLHGDRAAPLKKITLKENVTRKAPGRTVWRLAVAAGIENGFAENKGYGLGLSGLQPDHEKTHGRNLIAAHNFRDGPAIGHHILVAADKESARLRPQELIHRRLAVDAIECRVKSMAARSERYSRCKKPRRQAPGGIQKIPLRPGGLVGPEENIGDVRVEWECTKSPRCGLANDHDRPQDVFPDGASIEK